MYSLDSTNKFNKDFVKCSKRGLNVDLLKRAVKILEKDGFLPPSYKPHKLKGDYLGFWDAHILPDWIIIWDLNERKKHISLIRTGTHSDLF